MKIPEHPVATTLLRLPGLLYEAVVRLRNARYDHPSAVRRASLPVISVGNITVGGTGKTPVVEWIARRLLDDGHRPAIVSRGYGGTAGRGPLLVSSGTGPLCQPERCGDEPYQLATTLPGVPIVVGSDRPAGAEEARRRGADVVVLDDGFQHRRLARDLDIVLLDAGSPFGNGLLLPAGPLREPLDGLRRADLFLITRSERTAEHPLVEQQVRQYNRDAPLLRAGHRRVGFVSRGGEPVPAPGRAVAFCGIGNPESFRADLLAEGIEIVEFLPFPDHHAYGRDDLQRIVQAAEPQGAATITTEKDLARLSAGSGREFAASLCALRIEAEPFDPAPLLQALRQAIAGAPE